MFSGRVPSHIVVNRLSLALASMRERGIPVIDLTESNPTRVDLPYPETLLRPLAAAASLRYEPDPMGMASARAAVAGDQARRGMRVDPGHVVLTSSTSEAYSWLFKLLCNPGDAVLVPRPSYPLFEHLTALEGIRACPYALEYHGRWEIDFDSMVRAAPATTRALLLVSPNNPTGSYLTSEDFQKASRLCLERGWAVVADEVFADYPLDASAPLTDIAARSDVLSFTLAGLSKTAGLPQLKLGWIIVGGPPSDRDAALAALELIADSYLSVATPVQVAAASLLQVGSSIRAAIQDRIAQNLRGLRAVAARFPACEVLRTEGDWSAVVRVPSVRREEELVVELLEREQILVHPGYFFDFPREAYIVLSLLPLPPVFGRAAEQVLRFVST